MSETTMSETAMFDKAVSKSPALSPEASAAAMLPPETPAERSGLPVAAMAAAGLVGLIVGTTALLWAHFGSTVFFEMMRAGFISCFG